ncbi:MAG TPA: asparagine synthase (glutamine-hydrolyzing) [Xanthobacteraceae bacterium]|jgi:asparagine synthase (glutamine-hydrolysing)|nr:asparagine synthase (glutamine-hydrolyzing) [Xanthobacteraceae bacterium]
MCGIAGFIGAVPNIAGGDIGTIAEAMAKSIAYRGPDDQGIWMDPEAGTALVHRRLSIIDLSSAGHQPMLSADERYVISYNGEVYSFQAMAAELATRGHRFRGHSDTEVILESFAANGIEATLKQMIGMFAIALWDRRDRTLTLMRDRLGIKPLYWAKFGSTFMFGSELKALRAHPGWTPRIDQSAVAAFTRHNYIPAPRTIYEGVHKLEPGTILTLPWQGEPKISRFWDARSVARNGSRHPLEAGDSELTEQLESLLKDAVGRRMIADVPLGAFLSGGVDSSTVVALMQAAKSGPVKSFSIGFDIEGYNEAHHAAAVARHLRTDHTELTVTAKEALDVIPRLPDFYDEPFADSSQIPTYLVSAMTRKYVTVALSGDGGDELFAGYNRYQLTQRFWRSLSLMPRALRNSTAAAITAVRPDRWTQLLGALPQRLRLPQAGDKMHKAASVLRLDSADAVYRRLVSHWEPSEIMPQVGIQIEEPRGILDDATLAKDFPDLLARMQFLDLVTYLPDDILTKVDRASMAHALEARVPLIDHRVVEFAWRLPEHVKVRNGTSKWLLRQVLYRHVPPELIERPKMGFGIPLGEWLRGPLRDWAETLLGEQRLHEAGLLDATVVRRYWRDHLEGRRNWQYLLWDVLMLEAWRERWA